MTNENRTPYVEFTYDPSADTGATRHNPASAAAVIPDWYRSLEAFSDANDPVSSTVKLCRPFYDALRQGFILPTPSDVEFEKYPYGLLEATGRAATVYGPTPYENDENSRYPFPEAKIRLPWRITTPPGYSLLLTKPLNREETTPEIKPHSILIPADEYNGPISVPVTVSGDHVTLEAGTPLVQAIPLKRSCLLPNAEAHPESAQPELRDQYNRRKKRSNARSGLYRTVHWVKKPRTTVYTADESVTAGLTHAVTDCETDSEGDSVTESGDETWRFITKDKNFGIIPEPVPAAERAPPWLEDLASVLEEKNPGDPDAERFQEWITGATSLGVVTQLHAEVHVQQDASGEGQSSSRFDRKASQMFHRQTIGDDFPLPFGLPNLYSEWVSATPAGYSNLYVEPFSHHQQWYRSFSGIVDDDRYRDNMNAPGRLVTEKSEITFPPGMPVCQVVPIHRPSIIEYGVIREPENSDGHK